MVCLRDACALATKSAYVRLKLDTLTMLKAYFEAVLFEGVDLSALT